MTKIAPSMLSADFGNLAEELAIVKNAGAEYAHLDVMDGIFVPNISYGLPVIKGMRKYSDLVFDCHLMITDPEKYVEQFVVAGADIVTFHPNATTKPIECLELIHNKGAKAGIALNPDIPWEEYSHLIEKCDQIVIMGVYAGFGGQKLILDTLPKMAELKAFVTEHNYNCEIEFDGGVTEANAQQVVEAGADVLVAGTAFFGSQEKVNTVRVLKGIL